MPVSFTRLLNCSLRSGVAEDRETALVPMVDATVEKIHAMREIGAVGVAGSVHEIVYQPIYLGVRHDRQDRVNGALADNDAWALEWARGVAAQFSDTIVSCHVVVTGNKFQLQFRDPRSGREFETEIVDIRCLPASSARPHPDTAPMA